MLLCKTPEVAPRRSFSAPPAVRASTISLKDRAQGMQPLCLDPPSNHSLEMPMHSHIAALPKADIHIHQEWSPRLDQVLARQEGRAPYNTGARGPPVSCKPHRREPPACVIFLPTFPHPWKPMRSRTDFVARVVHMLEEAAADGAVLVETPPGQGHGGQTRLPDALPRRRTTGPGAVSALACRRDSLRASGMGGGKKWSVWCKRCLEWAGHEAGLWCRYL